MGGEQKYPAVLMRVLFFEPYPMGLGGNFQTQAGFIRFLAKRDVSILVVAPRDGIALDEFRRMGVECQVVHPPNSIVQYGGGVFRHGAIRRLRSVLDLLRYNLRLGSLIRKRKVDVVYANCVRAALSAGFAARMAGCPMLLYIKGELANPLIDRLSFLLADRILFFCESNRDDKYPRLIRRFRKKIDILKIGFDPGVIRDAEARDHTALRRELGIEDGWSNAVVLGQLYRPKGQHLAIEALATIVKDVPNVRLYLVGDEVIREYRGYRGELESLVRRHGLEEHVRFTGWRTDALDIVAEMDIVIHPSLAEGFGRAVLESMALGLPVIASKVGGLREAIKNGENGFLVDPGDTMAIADRWRELLASEELRRRLRQEGRRTVFTEYLMEDKAARFAEILGEMANAKA